MAKKKGCKCKKVQNTKVKNVRVAHGGFLPWLTGPLALFQEPLLKRLFK